MKKNLKLYFSATLALLVVALMMAFPPRSFACGGDENNELSNCVEYKGSEDYFSSDASLKTSKTTNHSLFLAGNEVDSKDEVKGIGLLAGNLVSADGVYDYGFFAGNSLKFSGETKNDLFLAGNAVVIDEDATIGRDLFAVGNTLNISANLNGNVFAAGNRLVLDSVTIDGNLDVSFDQIVIKGKSSISGTFKYNENAVISGLEDLSFTSSETYVSKPESSKPFFSKLLTKLVSISGYIILTVVLITIFKKFTRKMVDKFETKDTFKDALIGLGLLIFVPLLSIFVAITILGLPLALITFTLWAFGLILSLPVSGLLLGEKIFAKISKKKTTNLYLSAILGIVLISLLELVPFLGTLVSLMPLVFGLGFLFDFFRKSRKN